jgi:hypothetical protein
MRESRLSGSEEGVVCKHDSYSDSVFYCHTPDKATEFYIFDAVIGN